MSSSAIPRLVALFGVAVALTSCAIPEPSNWNGTVPEAVTTALSNVGNTEIAQRAILEAAAHDTRDVVFGEYSDAAEATVTCLTDSGYDANVTWLEGAVSPVARFEADVDAGKQAAYNADYARCFDAHVSLIEYAYLERAVVIRWREHIALPFASAMEECATQKGISVASGEQPDTIALADLEANPTSTPGELCLATTGLGNEPMPIT